MRLHDSTSIFLDATLNRDDPQDLATVCLWSGDPNASSYT